MKLGLLCKEISMLYSDPVNGGVNTTGSRHYMVKPCNNMFLHGVLREGY